ncbi:MAG TPA: zf-HC2 domain-containing protein, partial [Ktedonobacterales bacterium]|nr:zf-HC2 domain-containing protein [Ktedonobacterales bacterium]
MATNPVECPELVENETLSALRDDLLSGDEAARLREHLPSCAACQARLNEYDEVARALLRQ